jgi:hypothetical protein
MPGGQPASIAEADGIADRAADEERTRGERLRTEGDPRFLEYRPPMRGAPTRRIGGSTRGNAGAQDLLTAVLAPEDVGLTTAAQPALYWFASRPIRQPVEVVVISNDRIDPVLEVRHDAGAPDGINRIALADHGVMLAVDGAYRWSVAVVHDPDRRSRDLVTTGSLRRVAPPPSLAARLASTPLSEHPRIYAEAGLWYDAVEALAALVASAPDPAVWRQRRAALMQQVGLDDVARFDLRQ